jgi:hypothetical protein
VVSIDDFIGYAVTYEDMSAFTLATVHHLGVTGSAAAKYNRHRIGFATSFAPIATGLPADYPPWVKAQIAGHSPFAGMTA